jgi:hypothetical protein
MTLIATIAATGLKVESFTIPQAYLAELRKLPIGTFVIGANRTPAVLKRSGRGLQFFAAAPGFQYITEGNFSEANSSSQLVSPLMRR